jgi:predicted MFS family arabinose efflux permease
LHDRIEPQTTWLAIREGVRLLLHDPVLRALAGARTTLSFFIHLWLAMLLLFLTRGLGLDPGVVGVLFAVGGVCSLVGATLADRVVRRLGLGSTLILTLCITSAGLLLVPLAAGPFVVVVGLVGAQQLADGPATIYQIHETSLIQATVPERSLGRVTASLRVLGWSAMLGGTIVGGLLGEALGPRPAMLVGAVGALPAALWLLWSPVRALHTLPAVSEDAAGEGATS